MSSELRPCPICHKPAKGEASVCDYIILCRPCGLKMRRNSEHRDAAISAWNRRAPSPAVKALVEACRRMVEHVNERWPEGFTCGCCDCAKCWELSDAAAAESALAAVEREIGGA